MESKNYPGGPPPAPGFIPPPPYNAASPPLMTQPNSNVVMIAPINFGPESQRLTCPHCQANISTSVESESTTKTHLFALLLCLFGLWCCVPCPYCMDGCMARNHYCPACNHFLGQYQN